MSVNVKRIAATRNHRQAAPRLGRSRMQGMGMIEVLVSVLVLAVGLLGIAAMQSLALRGGQSSLETSQAIMQANSIIEAMRANPTANYNIGKTCSAASITGTDARATDLIGWVNAMKNTIGSGATDTTTCGEIVGCPGACLVRVYWDDSRAGNDQNGAARMVETGARI
ncbi:MAG: type IV pilus modification protein PilV [Stenotrophomonas sp.]